MSGMLEGKAALVTGGASGIGRATALAFARAGARLVVTDRDAAGGEETVRQARAVATTAHFVAADVTSTADVHALVARTVELLGRLDCAFNNAGIEGVLAPLADYPEETFSRVLDVNVAGVYRCMRAEIAAMLPVGSGAIVNTASVAGLVGAGGLSAYVASKHAVVGLTRSAAIDYAKLGIRVNAVCPGVIDTPMLDRLVNGIEGLREALVMFKPMGRTGRPAEVAEAVVWLCSDAASFVTGHTLTVDGGFVAQ